MKKIKCLVLGGCGFLGSHLVEGLLDRGYEVSIFDRINVDTKNIQNRLNDVTLFKGDFNNKNDLKNVVRDIDYVFHFISTSLPDSATQNPIYDIETNVISTINLLEIAKSANVKRIIFASSGGTIYGIPKKIPISEDHSTHPICAYGISKLMIEKYLHLYFSLYGLDYISLRISNAYGERQDPDRSQGAVAVFLGNILKGNPIHIWGDGEVVRDFIHVEDIVAACLKTIRLDHAKYRIFNIGSGIETSLNDLIEIIGKVTGRRFIVNYTKGRKIDVPRNILDTTRITEILGWRPKVTLEEGVKKVYKSGKSVM